MQENRYDAFGNGLESLEQVPNRMRCTGQQFEELTGQYYLGTRYYKLMYGHNPPHNNSIEAELDWAKSLGAQDISQKSNILYIFR